MKNDKFYEFMYSFKHRSCYESADKQYIISGDIYRDEFYPVLTESDMEYFINSPDINVEIMDIRK